MSNDDTRLWRQPATESAERRRKQAEAEAEAHPAPEREVIPETETGGGGVLYGGPRYISEGEFDRLYGERWL